MKWVILIGALNQFEFENIPAAHEDTAKQHVFKIKC